MSTDIEIDEDELNDDVAEQLTAILGRLREKEEKGEEKEEEEVEEEPEEPVFKTRKGRKRISVKKTINCPKCGSDNTERYGEDDTIYSYKRNILEGKPIVCNNCGHKFGVVKE